MAAIYQWFVNKAVTITTTPYPIEIVEGVDLSAQLDQFFARDIQHDRADVNWSFDGGSMRTLLLSYGPDSDDANLNWSFDGGSLRTLLLSYGPDQDDVNTTWSFDGGSMVSKLISTQIYPHGLDMAPQLNSMTMEDAP